MLQSLLIQIYRGMLYTACKYLGRNKNRIRMIINMPYTLLILRHKSLFLHISASIHNNNNNNRLRFQVKYGRFLRMFCHEGMYGFNDIFYCHDSNNFTLLI